MRGRVIAFVLGLSVSLGFFPRGATAAVTIEKVAVTGEHAPGTPANVTFLQFWPPVINTNGQIVFYAQLAGDSINTSTDDGLWLKGAGPLGLVVREGDPAAAPPSTAVFLSLPGSSAIPAIDASNAVSFLGAAGEPGNISSNFGGIWRFENGVKSLIVRKGDPAPGLSGVSFDSFDSVVVNGGGKIIFASDLSTADQSIWAWSSPPLFSLVAKTGDTTPDAGGESFLSISELLQIGASGSTIVQASLSGGGVGIWSNPGGTLGLIAKIGDSAPGLPGLHFDGFGLQVLNATGRIAFLASLASDPGVDSTNDAGLWSNSSGSLAKIARDGEPAPGLPDVIISSITSAALDDSGHIVFSAQLTGAGVPGGGPIDSVWSDRSGSLALAVRTGDLLPGLPAGSAIASINSFRLSGGGRIAIVATVSGPGINATNNQGVWAEDATRHFRRIRRTGDTIAVGNNDSRTVTSLVMSDALPNIGDGRGTVFNNIGNLVFVAGFADSSSGVFSATISGVDIDGDEIDDALDNCPNIANPNQADADSDGIGNVCDTCTDTDGDGFGNPGFPANTCALDNCPSIANPSQADADSDGIGDACDSCTDTDGDGFGNPGFPANTCPVDNCPNIANPSQADSNSNGVGDACDSSQPGPGPGPGPGDNPGPGDDPNNEPPPVSPMGCGGCGAGTASITTMMLPLLLLAKAARRRRRTR